MTQLSKIETVFVATDFSKTADTAIEWAARLARAHRSRIVLYHGVRAPAPPVLSPAHAFSSDGAFENDCANAHERLRRTAESLRRRGLRAEIDVQVDLGANTILSRADAAEADLIIAGTRRPSVKKSILGSTATQLVRKAPVPVLVVPPGASLPNSQMHHVLFPTDLDTDVQEAFDEVEAVLGRAGVGTDVTLMHVYGSEYDASSPWAAPLLTSRRTKKARSASQRLEMLANQLSHHFRSINTITCSGDVARTIDHEAHLLGADLIVIPQGRTGIGQLFRTSTAERILAQAPCPVLTLQRKSRPEALGRAKAERRISNLLENALDA